MQIQRDKYLGKLAVKRNNKHIKIITGLRRSGKSYLLNILFYEFLKRTGVDDSHIIKFSFDSSRDLGLIGEDAIEINKAKKKVNSQKFMSYIKSRIIDDKKYYLLLDEIQELETFEEVLSLYLKESNIDIYVTGDNSKLLSTDIITGIDGRVDQIHLLPLSFSEFISCYDGSIDEALDDYYIYGGLPDVALMKNKEQKVQYLNDQIYSVYLKDIIQRYKLKNQDSIGELMDVLASGIATFVNPLKLSNTFKSVKKEDISYNTISSYLKYMEETFMIKTAKRYDVKAKKYISTPFKIYFEDVGIRNAKLNFQQIEKTHLMENIIFNELRYRDFNVDVGVVEHRTTLNGKTDRKYFEIDFVANSGSKKYYIQSAYDILDDDKMKQETKSFDMINDSFKKIIIVNKTIKPRTTENGYSIISLKDFLLNPYSLDL